MSLSSKSGLQANLHSGSACENGTADKGDRNYSHIYRRVGLNSAFLGGGLAVSSAFLLAALAIGARALDARQFGIFVLLRSVTLLLQATTSFATQQAVIKLGSDAFARNDKQTLGQLISLALFIDCAAGILAFAAAAILVGVARPLVGLDVEHVGSVWILAASLVFASYPASNGIYRLYDRFQLLACVQALPAAGLMASYVILYLNGGGLWAFVCAWAVYLAFTGQLQLWTAIVLLRRHDVPLRPRAFFLYGTEGQMLVRYCWTTWVTSTVDAVRSNADSLVVGAIVSVEAAGLYGLARQISGMLRKFTTIYASTVFPEIARFAAMKEDAGALRFKRRMIGTTVIMGTACVLVTAMFGQPLLHWLFGARFTAAYVCLVVLAAAAAAQMVSYTPSMYVQVYKGPVQIMFLNVLATAAFAVVAVPLTFAFSMVGMAMAQLAFGLVLLMLCTFDLRFLSASLARESRASPTDPAASTDLGRNGASGPMPVNVTSLDFSSAPPEMGQLESDRAGFTRASGQSPRPTCRPASDSLGSAFAAGLRY